MVVHVGAGASQDGLDGCVNAARNGLDGLLGGLDGIGIDEDTVEESAP